MNGPMNHWQSDEWLMNGDGPRNWQTYETIMKNRLKDRWETKSRNETILTRIKSVGVEKTSLMTWIKRGIGEIEVRLRIGDSRSEMNVRHDAWALKEVSLARKWPPKTNWPVTEAGGRLKEASPRRRDRESSYSRLKIAQITRSRLERERRPR